MIVFLLIVFTCVFGSALFRKISNDDEKDPSIHSATVEVMTEVVVKEKEGVTKFWRVGSVRRVTSTHRL